MTPAEELEQVLKIIKNTDPLLIGDNIIKVHVHIGNQPNEKDTPGKNPD